ALKKNPYPFIIPCHRVIRSDGYIGGYVYGKRIKRILIELEKDLRKALKM
ncbi:MAG TPA: MGMT family protein, partial [Candidatus Omnitrophica bacterium]|nr:MGMT family protein [Candidatus Omnitrophota bacterium]